MAGIYCTYKRYLREQLSLQFSHEISILNSNASEVSEAPVSCVATHPLESKSHVHLGVVVL
jgi:hypothetical protein